MKLKLLAIIVSVSVHANELHQAVSEYNMFAIERILNQKGFEDIINQHDDDGKTPLSIAVENDDIEIVQMLVNAGADINVQNNNGDTPLNIAAAKQDRELVAMLLRYTFDTTANMHRDKTLLQFIFEAYGISCRIDQLILRNSAHVDSQTIDRGSNPLYITPEEGKMHTIKSLLEKADVHYSMNHDMAVHITGEKEYKKFVQLLLDAAEKETELYEKEDLHIATEMSVPIDANELHKAVSAHNMSEIERSLNQEGFEDIINQHDDSGQTPLSIAVKNDDIEIVQKLLSKGATVSFVDDDGNTLLHIAAKNKSQDTIEIIKLLMSRGADATVKNKGGKTSVELIYPQIFKKIDILTQSTAQDPGEMEAIRWILFTTAPLLSRKLQDEIMLQDELYQAFFVENIDLVKIMLANSICRQHINQRDELGATLLMYAAARGDLALVKLLLEYGAIPTIKMYSGLNIISLIVFRLQHRNVSMNFFEHLVCMVIALPQTVISLLMGNRDRNYMAILELFREWEKSQASLFHDAIFNDDKQTIENMLSVDTSIVNVPDEQGHLPLVIALLQQNREIIELLLDRGADVNLRGGCYLSLPTIELPLHFAVEQSDRAIIELLIKRGANINLVSTCGMTALHVAVKRNDIEIVELLLQYNANTNAQDNDGDTPSHLAAGARCDSNIMLMLLQRSANINIRNARETNEKAILWCGGDVNSRAIARGYTPLHIATENGNIGKIELLLGHGADVDCLMNNGDTALHIAVESNNIEIVKLLLDAGADVNSLAVVDPDEDTQSGGLEAVTPLMGAVACGNIDLVKLLLEHGANPTIETKNGWNIFRMISFVLERQNDPLPPKERETCKAILRLCVQWVGKNLLLLPARSKYVSEAQKSIIHKLIHEITGGVVERYDLFPTILAVSVATLSSVTNK